MEIKSSLSIMQLDEFKGLFILVILLLCAGLLKENLVRIPFIEDDEPYTIKMKKPSRSEKHLEGLDQNERALIKHMAKMIVNYVIRNA